MNYILLELETALIGALACFGGFCLIAGGFCLLKVIQAWRDQVRFAKKLKASEQEQKLKEIAASLERELARIQFKPKSEYDVMKESLIAYAESLIERK